MVAIVLFNAFYLSENFHFFVETVSSMIVLAYFIEAWSTWMFFQFRGKGYWITFHARQEMTYILTSNMCLYEIHSEIYSGLQACLSGHKVLRSCFRNLYGLTATTTTATTTTKIRSTVIRRFTVCNIIIKNKKTLSVKVQGHPTTGFCKISVSEKQILPRIFYYLRSAKNF